MPYPRAHFYVAGLVLLTFWAFWPGYLSQLASSPWQYHFHGITAGLWLLLLIWQSWSIQSGKRELHRTAGLGVFVLAPLFLAGSLLVLGTMSARTDPFMEMFGGRLGILDFIAAVAFTGFVFGALRNRRDIHVHAGYMLVTPFLLFGPVASRVLPGFVPGLTMRSLEDLPRFGTSLQICQTAALLLAAWLYARNRRQGRPFLAVAVVLAIQSVCFETVGRTAQWGELYARMSDVPSMTLALAGIAIGVVIVYFGWARPERA